MWNVLLSTRLRILNYTPRLYVNRPIRLSIQKLSFLNITSEPKKFLKLKNTVHLSYSQKALYHESIMKFSSKEPAHFNELTKSEGKKALELIFGPKKYQEFTEEEKKLVDQYQDGLLQVDGGIVLPNTRMAIEQKKADALRLKINKTEN